VALDMALPDEPTLVEDLYVLPRDPLGSDVLIPAFRQATSVGGAFGWFSSSWIARLAAGLAVYLNREGVGAISFTIAPAIFDHDWEDMNRGVRDPVDVLYQRVADAFDEGRVTESALAKHAVECMAWLLAEGRLCLKVALPFPRSTYHPKMWVFKDESANIVTIRGSGNVTGPGVYENVENMDVDTSWPSGPGRRLTKTAREVEALWAGTSDLVSQVYGLDEAVKHGLLKHLPPEKPTEDGYFEAAKIDGVPWAKTKARPSASPFPERESTAFHIPEGLVWEGGDYAHQGEAVRAWEAADRRGVVEMATGAGKTIAALIAAYFAYVASDEPFLIVISAPSNLLVAQWVGEVRRFGLEAAAPTLTSSSIAKRRLLNFRHHSIIAPKADTHYAIRCRHLLAA
jgi:Type III restriction enzyme, res subunit